MQTQDRVVETSTTEGTGDFTLLGSPVGYLPFSPEFALDAEFEYLIEIEDSSEWEIGIGHLLDATTLVRDSVERSTNADTFVDFSAGLKTVSNIVTAATFNGLGVFEITDSSTWDFGTNEDDTVVRTILNASLTNANLQSFTFIPTGTTETSLDDFNLNGVTFNIENIVDNVSFDIRATASNEASGVYTGTYKVIYA